MSQALQVLPFNDVNYCSFWLPFSGILNTFCSFLWALRHTVACVACLWALRPSGHTCSASWALGLFVLALTPLPSTAETLVPHAVPSLWAWGPSSLPPTLSLDSWTFWSGSHPLLDSWALCCDPSLSGWTHWSKS